MNAEQLITKHLEALDKRAASTDIVRLARKNKATSAKSMGPGKGGTEMTEFVFSDKAQADAFRKDIKRKFDKDFERTGETGATAVGPYRTQDKSGWRVEVSDYR